MARLAGCKATSATVRSRHIGRIPHPMRRVASGGQLSDVQLSISSQKLLRALQILPAVSRSRIQPTPSEWAHCASPADSATNCNIERWKLNWPRRHLLVVVFCDSARSPVSTYRTERAVLPKERVDLFAELSCLLLQTRSACACGRRMQSASRSPS